MGLRKNIRIYPQRDSRDLALQRRAGSQHFKLGLALHVEQQDARFERSIHLPYLLSDPGENNTRQRLRARTAYPFQLATGNDIESAAKLSEHLQNRQRRVRL